MTKRKKFISTIFLVFAFFFEFCGTSVFAQTETEPYTAIHTDKELSNLFSQVKTFLDENGETILKNLDDTQSRIITQSLIRSWAIVQYEDASPQQIDDAWNALYNMSLFLGLAADPAKTFSTGTLFEYAVQLLDQEYFDLLTASGENPETIEYAEYLRGIAEGLVETPEEFSSEEVQKYLFEIYQEAYLAAGLKAISHTEALPQPDELFTEQQSLAMIPNPAIKYDSAAPLNEMLGITMPELNGEFDAKTGYYSIIAETVAEIEYNFPSDGILILRLSPETEADISGVYGAEFYKEWEIAGTKVEVDRYQSMLIARGIVKTQDEKAYSFAVDAENLTEEQFYRIVVYFIENCRNQTMKNK